MSVSNRILQGLVHPQLFRVSTGGLESSLKLQQNTADVIAIGMIKNDEKQADHPARVIMKVWVLSVHMAHTILVLESQKKKQYLEKTTSLDLLATLLLM